MHTQTKWKICDNDFEGTVLIGTSTTERTDWICQVNPGEETSIPGSILPKEAQSNINLILAAPELLEASKQLLDSLCHWLPKYGDSGILESELVTRTKTLINKLS